MKIKFKGYGRYCSLDSVHCADSACNLPCSDSSCSSPRSSSPRSSHGNRSFNFNADSGPRQTSEMLNISEEFESAADDYNENVVTVLEPENDEEDSKKFVAVMPSKIKLKLKSSAHK